MSNYDFRAPQYVDFASSRLHEDDTEASRFFDCPDGGNEVSFNSDDSHRMSFERTLTPNMFDGLPKISITAATPSVIPDVNIIPPTPKVPPMKVVTATPLTNRASHKNRPTLIGSTPLPVGEEKSRKSSVTPGSAVGNVYRRRSRSCPDMEGNEEMDVSTILSEAFHLLKMSTSRKTPSKANNNLGDGATTECESILGDNSSDLVESIREIACIRSKRKMSPPPREIRDYSLQPSKYMSMDEKFAKAPTYSRKHLQCRGTQNSSPANRSKSTKQVCRKEFEIGNSTGGVQMGVKVKPRPVTKVEPFKLTEYKPKEAKPVDPPIPLNRPSPSPIRRRSGVNAHGSPLMQIPVLDENGLRRSGVYHSGVQFFVQNSGQHPHSKAPLGGCSRPLKVSGTVPVPFSFEERDKDALKRRQEKLKKIEEEEKKRREFHATPLPLFPEPKPLPRLTTLTKSHPPKLTERKRNKSVGSIESIDPSECVAVFKARPPTVLYKKPFMPHKSEREPVEPIGFKFSTELRSKKRAEFEIKVKEKEMWKDQFKQQLAEEERKRLEEEDARRRKETVHKPLPMPKHCSFKIKQSDKPLTDPRTPDWVKRYCTKEPSSKDDQPSASGTHS